MRPKSISSRAARARQYNIPWQQLQKIRVLDSGMSSFLVDINYYSAQIPEPDMNVIFLCVVDNPSNVCFLKQCLDLLFIFLLMLPQAWYTLNSHTENI